MSFKEDVFLTSWLRSKNNVLNLDRYGRTVVVEKQQLHEIVDKHRLWDTNTKNRAHELIEELEL